MFNFLNNKNTRIYLSVVVVLILLIVGAFSYYFTHVVEEEERGISSYEECISTPGTKTIETYPPQCITEDGQTFSPEIEERPDLSKEIQVANPAPNQIIDETLEVSGQISGSWLFEAQTSMKLYDSNNNLITESTISTKSDWMTSDLVPFTGTLTFEQPEDTQKGKIVIEKANPSGIEANKKEFEIPIYFK